MVIENRREWFALAFVACLTCGGMRLTAFSSVAAPAPTGNDLFVAVDFYDELGFAYNRPAMTSEGIRSLVRKFKGSGVSGLLWRLAPLGVAGYPSDLLTKIAELDSVSHNEDLVNRQGETPLWWGDDYVEAFARTLETIDPCAEVVKACHEEGLLLYFWIDLFDEMLSKFLCAHPECLVHTPDGARYPGLRDYANETAVREKLDELAELYKYKPDGFYLCSSCHARHLNFPEPAGAFGTLPAAKFTKFLRRLKEECSPHGVKLMVMAPFGGSLNFNSAYFSSRVMYRIEVDWKRWIDEGLADSLMLADYELIWNQDGIWESKGLTDIGPGHYPLDVYAPEFVQYNGCRSKLYFWCGLYPENHVSDIARCTDYAIKHRLDGFLVHEAMLVENSPEDLSALKDAKCRLSERPLAVAATSPSAVVWADPDDSLLWKTVREPAHAVSVDWPENASSAILSVARNGHEIASETLTDKSSRSHLLSFDFPSTDAAESVFDLALAFRDDEGTILTHETRRARVGLVRGVDGRSFRLVPPDVPKEKWGMAGARTVLPVPSDTASIALDGVNLTLFGCPGWTYLPKRIADCQALVHTSRDGETISVFVFGGRNGLSITVK